MSKHRTRRTRLNRFLSGVLCLVMVLGLLPTAGLVQTADAASWADPYGEQLVEWGIMKRSSDLRLGDTITRAEFVAMCNRAFGYSRLGRMPFVDVPSSAWYAQDINIGYNAGYFKGTTSDPAYPKASPNGTLTREQAAGLVARNLMLRETVGEVTAFTDSHDLSEWSRGLIGAAVAEGMIGGYEDGSYRPAKSITRGEVAKMLVSVIGTPVSAPGRYELGSVYGNVVISSSNVTLRNSIIVGNLYITGGVDLGNVLLENVTVLGRIVVSGGGESHSAQSSVVLRNVEAEELVVDSMINHFVTISAYGLTDIPVTYVRSSVYLDDSSDAGYGLYYIELDAKPGALFQLAGTIKEVVNKTPSSELQLVQGTAEKITIDEYATNTQVVVGTGTRIDELNLDVATLVTGNGDIITLNIWAAGCEVDILPENLNIRPGITAIIDGQVVDHTGAAELSSKPRLLAGYPKVAGLTPTRAEGLYSGNKPGTIYYAVSELANGSVSVEDLVDNPAYGGNIFKDGDQNQSGKIDASAKTEYGRAITGLEPDGSYYITAMLEDGRGNRSPLKVFSFTTPDDTVPELLDGYISRETCDVVQFTGMANKSCNLYWVLLPAGANEPTPSNFKAGSFGNTYGYGSISVTKNAPFSIKVNSLRLKENTDYVLFVWLNDFDGALSSRVYRFDVHTPDETPPVVVRIEQTNFDLPDAIEFSFAINEAPSTLYWAVVTESNETFIRPDDNMNSPAIQIKVENGVKAGAIVSGGKAAAGANVDTEVTEREFLQNIKNKLEYSIYKTHNFKMYYVAKDAYGNYSEVGCLIIHTKDIEPPVVTLDDSETMDGKYVASGDLRIIFSEQVKGSTRLEAANFVDLYNEVLANEDVGGAALAAAKNALAAELRAHIQLWYRSRSVTEVDMQLPEVDSVPELGGTTSYKYGWINWREARVELQSDGRVVLTLPAGKAVSLGSGMDYFFRFIDVYDDSYDHNRLVVTDENGKIIDGGEFDNTCELYFSTVYATVWLSKDRTGASSTNENDPANGTPLDIVFDVTPESTSNMADTEYWDMVIWNTNGVPCKFDIWRSADGGAWDKIAMGATVYGQNMTAVSLNHFKDTEKVAQYETVVSGLLEGHTYKYAIHFTEVNGIAERESWTSLIKMEVRLVAGERGNLRTLSDDVYNVAGTYERLVVTEKTLNEISAVRAGSDTITFLEVEKQFTDDNPPEFWNSYPTFSATSGSITMQVALDREGTVYYVAAPADGTVPTSIRVGEGTVAITSKNDGSAAEPGSGVTAEGAQPSSTNKTYIPKSGSDIENHKYEIQFYKYDENKKVRSDEERKYYSPAFGPIFAGSYSDPEGIIKKGSIKYTTYARTERISGLKPDTWYYVYMVLQSDSNKLDEVVQIYRVKTSQAEPPTIAVSHSGTTAFMEVRDPESTTNELYDNPDLYYAIVRRDDMPEWFSYKYEWTSTPTGTAGKAYKPSSDGKTYKADDGTVAPSGAMTVLEAMISPAMGANGKTYFDVYAGDFNSPVSSGNLKYEVMSYITRANKSDGYAATIKPYGPFNKNEMDYVYDSDDMQMGGEYVILVCARHHDKPANQESAYGFSASQGLFMPDTEPPEFTGQTGYVEVRFTHVYDRSGKNDLISTAWEFNDDVPYYTYSGSLTLRFDKPIYVSRGGAYKKVVNKPLDSTAYPLASDEISILSVINASGFKIASGYEGKGDSMTFTLSFSTIGNGAGFTMTDLCNSSGVSKAPGATSAKKLVVYFNTRLTTKDIYPDEAVTDKVTHIPAFKITWQ